MKINILLYITASFLLGFFVSFFFLKSKFYSILEAEKKLFQKRSRSVLKGKISEQFAVFFPKYPFKASESKFLGKPIDFIVFEGLDNEDIKAIHFVEIKTAKSQLNKTERSLKDAIKSKKVFWHKIKL